jgi:hypothetical protein
MSATVISSRGADRSAAIIWRIVNADIAAAASTKIAFRPITVSSVSAVIALKSSNGAAPIEDIRVWHAKDSEGVRGSKVKLNYSMVL